MSQYQRSAVSDTLDPEILSKPIDKECAELCRVLCLFGCFFGRLEVLRKMNGEPYPPKAVYHLLVGLLCYASTVQLACPNFLDPKDARFRMLKGTMDTHFQKLQQDGIGAMVKHTAVISIDEENLLWDQGILGTSNPLALGVTLTQTHLDEAKRESNGSTTRLIWNLISEFFTKEKKPRPYPVATARAVTWPWIETSCLLASVS